MLKGKDIIEKEYGIEIPSSFGVNEWKHKPARVTNKPKNLKRSREPDEDAELLHPVKTQKVSDTTKTAVAMIHEDGSLGEEAEDSMSDCSMVSAEEEDSDADYLNDEKLEVFSSMYKGAGTHFYIIVIFFGLISERSRSG